MNIKDFLQSLYNKFFGVIGVKKDIPKGQLVGYSLPSFWMHLSNFDDLMKTLSNNKCNATMIELLGDDMENIIGQPELVKTKYKEILKSARKYNINIFINIVNWNSSIAANKDDEWFKNWVDFIEENGSDNVIIQAIAEWYDARNRSIDLDAKAQRWVTMVETRLSKWSLSYNKGSRPISALPIYKYIDFHIRHIGDKGGNDLRTICTTDTSSILNEIQIGGTRGTKFKPDIVQTIARPIIAAGKSFMLYGYLHRIVDKDAIIALKNSF